MTRTNMPRWIEAAEARRFLEAVMYDRVGAEMYDRVPKSPYCRRVHLGTTVANLPSRIFSILADGCRRGTSPR